jgi:hemolysin-activating ACP:hemolysin acyltransferase
MSEQTNPEAEAESKPEKQTAAKPGTKAAPAGHGASHGELSIRRFRNRREALGHALALLRDVEPFASYKFGRISASLSGQIRRGHYLFTIENDKLVGYIGWARCSKEVAEAWTAGEATPAYKDCLEGPCMVAMTFHAKSRAVTVFQSRQARKVNADSKVYIPREYTDNRPPKSHAVFNRVVAPEDTWRQTISRAEGKVTETQMPPD